MKTFAASISTAIALTALVQLCPAPPAVLGPIITGALAGEAGAITGAAASGKIGKRADKFGVVERDDDPFAGLPQPAADECKAQLNGVSVTFTPEGTGAFRIDGVPSACMTLSTVLLGEGTDAVPTPLGSAALEYTGLSDDDIARLQSALDGNGY